MLFHEYRRIPLIRNPIVTFVKKKKTAAGRIYLKYVLKLQIIY